MGATKELSEGADLGALRSHRFLPGASQGPSAAPAYPGETGASGFGRDNGLGARVSEPAPHWSVSVSRLARMSLRGSVGFLVFGLGLIRGGGWAIARLRGVFEVPPEVSQPSGQ